jgi:glycosyltransferase A (GT-A) superfamily protein (DUF2064 family)
VSDYFNQCALLLFRSAPEELIIFTATKNVQAIPLDGADSPAAEFEKVFSAGFRKAVALLHCPDGLHSNHLEEAFLTLRIMDYCLGPDRQKGLYLFGMNAWRPELLEGFDFNAAESSRLLTRRIGERKEVMYRLPVL